METQREREDVKNLLHSRLLMMVGVLLHLANRNKTLLLPNR